MIESCALTFCVWDGKIDVKNAVELGYMIMLDKPIILIVLAGTKVFPKLAGVADEIVELDLANQPSTSRRIGEAIDRVRAKLKEKADVEQEGSG